ncbi:MAG: ThuA domain-containing protein [Cyclobacteriaceae bacterium]
MNSRRSFLNKSLLVAAGGLLAKPLLSESRIHQANALPSLEGRKVLFIHGGWPGHQPVKFRDYMVPWMQEEGATVEVFDDLEPYTYPEFMDSIDLVIQVYTMSSITKEQEKGLIRAVRKGTGMAGWHGGMCDAFRNNVEYQFMTGGQWVSHPGGVVDYKVNIIDQEDEITADISDFDMKSEQYYMHVDPNVKVLATTQFSGDHASWIDGCVMPVAWKKMYGKGRIFYTSLGHNLNHVTEVPGAIEIIKRGIKWSSASKYMPAEKWISPIYKKS